MSRITTHVLDTARGVPASGLRITLHRLESGEWLEVASGVTDDDGRIPGFVPVGSDLPGGTYRIRFETAAYLERTAGGAFYPHADVVCTLEGVGHYHLPLLLSPFGYSTYRGS